MQNLEAVSAQLGKIAAAFKDGGLYFLIGVGLFLAYLVIMAAIKHKRQATQEFNFNLGKEDKNAAVQNGNGTPKICPAHSGLDARINGLEKYQEENSRQHKQLFDGMNSVSTNLAGLTASVKAAIEK